MLNKDVEKTSLNTDKERQDEKQETTTTKKSIYTADKIIDLFENSIKYKDKLNLPRKFAENENFRNGDQWGAITEKTKNYPRPVLNICGYIIEHKTANIQNSNIKLVFNDFNSDENGEMFTSFAQKEWERLKLDTLNQQILDDSAVKGVGQLYFYIEPEKTGQVKLKCEKIDPTNFHIGNPKEIDIQKQNWIAILQRLPKEDVEEIAKENNIKIDLEADEEIKGQEYNNKEIDIDGIEKINVINFFYRDRESETIKYLRVCNNTIIQEEVDLMIKKFPFASMRWADITENYYSKSEIDYLKTNQRQINALAGLQIMNTQLQGFPKMWSKKGALNPASVKGSIGEILIDNSQTQGLNFGWLQPAPISNQAMILQDNLINQSKALNGAHDVDTGAGNADNATAIMLLQKRSGIALEKLKRRYHQYIEDIGLIMLDFFCNYYIMDRKYKYTDSLGQEQEGLFNAEYVEPDTMELKVDVGVSSMWSEEFTITALDKFLQAGLIDFKTYLKHIPQNVVPFKHSLLKELEMKEEQQAQEGMDYLISTMSPAEKQIFEGLDEEGKNKVLMRIANKEEALARQGL